MVADASASRPSLRITNGVTAESSSSRVRSVGTSSLAGTS
jgi:hypothetical protein